MGIFSNRYPYTDFHELNLDFVLETIMQMKIEVKELLDKYADYKTLIAEANAYTDTQIELVRNSISESVSRIDTLSAKLDAEFLKLSNSISDTKTELQVDIDTKYLRNQQMIAKQWQDMKDYIEGQVFDIQVRNFFTGELVTVQSMFDYLAGLHLTDAGTYAQVSNINTYQHYIAKNETYSNVLKSSLTFFNS